MRSSNDRKRRSECDRADSRAYRPEPGPRQGWWGAMGLAFALGMLAMGLVATPSGDGQAAAGPQAGFVASATRSEVPTEWRIERRALRFDHMFRAAR